MVRHVSLAVSAIVIMREDMGDMFDFQQADSKPKINLSLFVNCCRLVHALTMSIETS